MKILFYMAKGGVAARHFEPAIRIWLERGDTVHVALDDHPKWRRYGRVLGDLDEAYPDFSFGPALGRDGGSSWAVWGERLRAAVDYLAFMEPPLRDAPVVRARVERKAPGPVKRIARTPLLRSAVARRAVRRLLGSIERSAPTSRGVEDFIGSEAPDLVLLTPLVSLRVASPQNDYLRAAKRLGVPTGLLVESWDNLTTKGMIHELPDFVTVWNEGQKLEALELHGVPEQRVLVTGAQSFDHWFGWQPSSTREEFCRRVGLDPERPYLLYMCSSPLVVGAHESAHIEQWLSELRQRGGPGLDRVQVLVRPHPSIGTAGQWRGYDLACLGEGVAIWPVTEDKPVDSETRSGLYDSIHHSAAVVGVNTSALIESAIVGRAVYTLSKPDLREGQEGMLHYALISEFGGGLLTIASSFDEHAEQLRRALQGEDATEQEERGRRFLEAFVRPHGLERPAAEVLVAAIDEAVARRGRGRRRTALPQLALRLASAPVARIVRWRVS